MSQLHTQLPPYAFKQAPRSGHVLPQPFTPRMILAKPQVPVQKARADEAAVVLGYN